VLKATGRGDIHLLRKGTLIALKRRNVHLVLEVDGAIPFQVEQVQDHEFIEPALAVAPAKDVHLVLDDVRSVELPHRGLSFDHLRNIESYPVKAIAEVYEDYIREHVVAVPAPEDDNVAALPEATGVAHPRLWSLPLLYLRAEPDSLLSVKNINIVHDFLLAVPFSASKDEEVLTEGCSTVTVPRSRREALVFDGKPTEVLFKGQIILLYEIEVLGVAELSFLVGIEGDIELGGSVEGAVR